MIAAKAGEVVAGRPSGHIKLGAAHRRIDDHACIRHAVAGEVRFAVHDEFVEGWSGHRRGRGGLAFAEGVGGGHGVIVGGGGLRGGVEEFGARDGGQEHAIAENVVRGGRGVRCPTDDNLRSGNAPRAHADGGRGRKLLVAETGEVVETEAGVVRVTGAEHIAFAGAVNAQEHGLRRGKGKAGGSSKFLRGIGGRDDRAGAVLDLQFEV